MVMINGFTTTGTNYGLKQAILLIICVLIVPALSQTCGDGNFVVATQGCNDGNTIDGDGCNSTCQV
jgi:cysteine-rich repeat protein